MARLDWSKLAIAAALLTVAALSWWLPRSFTPGETTRAPVARHEPDYTAENFTTVAVDAQGVKLYELSARRVLHFPDDDSTELEEPYLIQYRPGLAPTHTRARRGRIPADSRDILLTGEVHAARGRDPQGAAAEIRADSMRVQLEERPTKRNHGRP
jgi:lipopolysaccharide export system protein LptC